MYFSVSTPSQNTLKETLCGGGNESMYCARAFLWSYGFAITCDRIKSLERNGRGSVAERVLRVLVFHRSTGLWMGGLYLH